MSNDILKFFSDSWLGWGVSAVAASTILGIIGLITKKTIAKYRYLKRAREIRDILLKNNRPARIVSGNLLGLADRYVYLWNTTQKRPLQTLKSRFLTTLPNVNYHFHDIAIDKELAKLNLVKLDIHEIHPSQVSVIVNPLNTKVYVMCKDYLIKYCGDEKAAYDKLEQQL